MGQQRRWPLIRTVLFAHLLAFAVIGLCEFALTSVRHPTACCASPSAWDRLCYWVHSGRQRPLTDVLDAWEIRCLSETLAAVVFLGALLGWSIRSMRPFRLALRLRLQTLLAIVAIVPTESPGAVAVWKGWARWDRLERLADFNARWSAIEKFPIRSGNVLLVDVFEALPDRPLSGNYPVYSDGKIDLGYYGKVCVGGLTVSEAKEKIVLHLRRYLDDRQLGLIELSASEANAVPSWKTRPSESDSVFVCLVDFTCSEPEIDGLAARESANRLH
jgi:Polysaccharide biosynthesis/export protein